MVKRQISLTIDEELINQIKYFTVKSGMDENELIKSWIIKGLRESKECSNKKSLKDLANSITLPYTTDSVEITKKLRITVL